MRNYEHRPTQEQRILQMLYSARWEFVSSLSIVMELYILQYSARIWGLRKKGFNIKNEVETVTNQYGDKVKVWKFILKDAYLCEDCWKIMNKTMASNKNICKCKECWDLFDNE